MNTELMVLFFGLLAISHTQAQAAYGPPKQGGHGSGGGHGGQYEEPQAYEFGYRVKDDYSGSSFHQKESSDGSQVRGEYRVALPDGRTQIVTYYADWQTGFHADVKYEGMATYPEAKPQYGPPKAGGGGGGSSGGYNYPSPSG